MEQEVSGQVQREGMKAKAKGLDSAEKTAKSVMIKPRVEGVQKNPETL